MSNLATQARTIAVAARRAFPNAATLFLQAGDDEDGLTPASPFVLDRDGTEHDADEKLTEKLADPCADISVDEAANADAIPGWTVTNGAGVEYELDVDTVLAYRPTYEDSALAQVLWQVEALIAALPAEAPIIMVDEHNVAYPDYDEQTGEGLGAPRILAMTAHCPRCGSQKLAELDWTVNRNPVERVTFDSFDSTQPDLFAAVQSEDGDCVSLTFCCTDCGQRIDLDADDMAIKPVWH